ncbi:MAG TPA: NRDE family protein, partial [Geobacteraceae bacterium]
RHRYNDFNLLCGLLPGPLTWYSNRAAEPQELSTGVHGLSNHLLDTPWPKVASGKVELAALLAAPPAGLAEELFALLADRRLPPDRHLPETGFGLVKERLLAPRFIVSPTYGTRSSTIMIVRRDGLLSFYERSFAPDGESSGTVRYEIQLPASE